MDQDMRQVVWLALVLIAVAVYTANQQPDPHLSPLDPSSAVPYRSEAP